SLPMLFVFLKTYRTTQELHSFPTRRSSDLYARLEELLSRYPLRGIKGPVGTAQDMLDLLGGDAGKLADLEQRIAAHLGFGRAFRSEEHTSELQSRENLVCRLLLEKKK